MNIFKLFKPKINKKINGKNNKINCKNMNIDIIGGSDISAPIKRLQNAVSFNYYANTSIYDNRSDIGQYDGNGESSDVRSWAPTMKTKK